MRAVAYNGSETLQAAPRTDGVVRLREAERRDGLVTEEMLRALRGAAGLNDTAMQRLSLLLKEGVTERELAEQADVLYGRMRADGYFAFIAFGANTADPYHACDDTPLRAGDTVTIRLGCLLNDSFSMMARPFFFGGLDARQRDAFAAVRRANETAFAAGEPGAQAQRVVARMREAAVQAGFADCYRALDPVPQEPGIAIPFAIEELAGADARGICGTGAAGDVLEIGCYFAVAPGVYVPDSFGVCMADTVLLADYGLDVLSRFPHELAVL